jgi:hypothetical protein
MQKHVFTAEETPYGWQVKCSCGGFVLGYFGNAARAKRAAMNTSHPDDLANGKIKSRVEIMDKESDK